MSEEFVLNVNGVSHTVTVAPETPLLTVLRNDLDLKGPKYGCGLEQCGACKVLIDDSAVPSCQLPVKQAVGLSIITIEGLSPHLLQEAFVELQAIQCGYCASGMIMAAQGLLNRIRYPTDEQIREALADNICRCGVYERVRRAIKLRIGRPDPTPLYEVITPADDVADATDYTTAPPPTDLPHSLQRTPDLDTWIRINADETITIFSGKVEIGQGIKTAVAQIAADELDVALSRIEVISGDTARTPDEGVTAGSMSVQTSGIALRLAAAEARHLLLTMAFEELEAETTVAQLSVTDGIITDPATGRTTSYWRLMGSQRFGRQVSGTIAPKSPADHRLVGSAATRLDVLAKASGAPVYVHDLSLPDMVHGRVVRPPAYDAQLVSVDDTAVRQMPGVLTVVHDGRFLGVVAAREEQVVRAAEALAQATVWQNETNLPPMDQLADHMRAQPAQASLVVVDGTAVTDPIPPALEPASDRTLSATYSRPYHMHGSLGPSAAVAQMVDGHLTVWSHTQGAPLLRQTIAQVLGLDVADVRLIHTEGAGCYGHNGADDAALDAALLARAVAERPVALQWSREDEHGWEPYGAAMVVDMQASLDDSHGIADWRHDVWSYPHTARPRPGGDVSGLLAAWHLQRPFSPPQPSPLYGRHFGDYRNADPLYVLPQKRIVTHFVADSPLRTSSLRSLGAYGNVLAIESFMDELAYAAQADPVAFRLRHLDDARARAVVQAVAEQANWQERPWPRGDGHGRGIAFAQYKNAQCYAAIVVTVRVDLETGTIRLEEAMIAADAGQVINPDGLSNQLEGGFVQAASWTLFEQVAWDDKTITSRDWDSYPVLRFIDAPKIRTVLLNRPHLPPLGSGEATQGPTPAAIANAIFDATGVRLRDVPFTAEKMRLALAKNSA